jgi:hypothetical protein
MADHLQREIIMEIRERKGMNLELPEAVDYFYNPRGLPSDSVLGWPPRRGTVDGLVDPPVDEHREQGYTHDDGGRTRDGGVRARFDVGLDQVQQPGEDHGDDDRADREELSKSHTHPPSVTSASFVAVYSRPST